MSDLPISSNKPDLVIVFGVTGGRHMQMFGAAVALKEAFSDFNVAAYFGFSGGSIVAALMSSEAYGSEEDIYKWIAKTTPYGKHAKIGGFPNIFCNIWNLFRHGGLLNSKKLYLKVFSKIFNALELKTPAFAGAWCTSHSREVIFDLKKCCPGKSIACSAAMPFAISPVKMSNKELIELGYTDVLPGISEDPDGYSYFADGGISSSLGVGLIDETDVIQKIEQNLGYAVPVVGVNIDPVWFGHEKDFGNNSWYKKIWESCWGTVRSNILDDIREAKSERYLQLCVIPTPKHLVKFSTKFDATLEENIDLYETGYRQAKEWASKELDGFDTPMDAMKAWFEEQESSLN